MDEVILSKKKFFKIYLNCLLFQNGSLSLELCPAMYATWAVPQYMSYAYIAFGISAVFSFIPVPRSITVDRV